MNTIAAAVIEIRTVRETVKDGGKTAEIWINGKEVGWLERWAGTDVLTNTFHWRGGLDGVWAMDTFQQRAKEVAGSDDLYVALLLKEKGPTIPSVHLNGTDGNDLYEQFTRAKRKVEEAIQALHDACPHGRDYYVQDNLGSRSEDAALWRAVREHEKRIEKLVAVKDELEELQEGVIKQIEERDARRGEAWIDKHSVGCIRCGQLVDERECVPNTAEHGGDGTGGEICPACQAKSAEEAEA